MHYFKPVLYYNEMSFSHATLNISNEILTLDHVLFHCLHKNKNLFKIYSLCVSQNKASHMGLERNQVNYDSCQFKDYDNCQFKFCLTVHL